ncbi:saccharopine dehydrogenase [Spiractinospora alimapuensis]|uniref:saccharopine dehydrogenase n=1 Tax=Spiractinospora alimapuensis TaxID=2820884 RepID=UPI001F45F7B1|nr:saccharopine dehydrogenase [Spiractinospora alimapuensis]QVQ52724.1 saccharopine dehydrogenase [Spiractinospora alimapuensis]
MKVLVLGGYGAVGAHVVEGLRARGHDVSSAGRDASRADIELDLRGPRTTYRDVIRDFDLVANASGMENPALAVTATDQGVAFVDATATSDYVAAVERVSHHAPVLVSVGLAPGLTNLLATDLAAGGSDRRSIDIAIVLGAGDEHGRAATAWSLGLLGASFADPASGAHVRNFTHGTRFDIPSLGRRQLVRTDFSDQHALTRDLGLPVRTYFGLDSRVATAALRVLTRIPGASRLRIPDGVHPPGSDRWVVMARADDGSARWAWGRDQSRATGIVTVEAVERATDLAPGVHHVHQVMELSDFQEEQAFGFGP